MTISAKLILILTTAFFHVCTMENGRAPGGHVSEEIFKALLLLSATAPRGNVFDGLNFLS